MSKPPGAFVRSPPPAYLPPLYDEADTAALKALAAGNANEGQQRRALDWIITKACGTYDQPYRPGDGGDRETAFACGRMFVGQQIVKQLRLVKGAG